MYLVHKRRTHHFDFQCTTSFRLVVVSWPFLMAVSAVQDLHCSFDWRRWCWRSIDAKRWLWMPTWGHSTEPPQSASQIEALMQPQRKLRRTRKCLHAAAPPVCEHASDPTGPTVNNAQTRTSQPIPANVPSGLGVPPQHRVSTKRRARCIIHTPGSDSKLQYFSFFSCFPCKTSFLPQSYQLIE